MNVKLKIIKTNIDKGRSFFLFLSFLNTALVDTCLRKGEKMTDLTKYRNVSLSRKTYEDLQNLSKELLPGNTELSISKTIETLVNERKEKMKYLVHLKI